MLFIKLPCTYTEASYLYIRKGRAYLIPQIIHSPIIIKRKKNRRRTLWIYKYIDVHEADVCNCITHRYEKLIAVPTLNSSTCRQYASLWICTINCRKWSICSPHLYGDLWAAVHDEEKEREADGPSVVEGAVRDQATDLGYGDIGQGLERDLSHNT